MSRSQPRGDGAIPYRLQVERAEPAVPRQGGSDQFEAVKTIFDRGFLGPFYDFKEQQVNQLYENSV